MNLGFQIPLSFCIVLSINERMVQHEIPSWFWLGKLFIHFAYLFIALFNAKEGPCILVLTLEKVITDWNNDSLIYKAISTCQSLSRHYSGHQIASPTLSHFMVIIRIFTLLHVLMTWFQDTKTMYFMSKLNWNSSQRLIFHTEIWNNGIDVYRNIDAFPPYFAIGN